MKITEITFPHMTLQKVGPVLQAAGFELGTVGDGCGTMEREGEITDEERQELSARMAKVLFEFEVYDSEE